MNWEDIVYDPGSTTKAFKYLTDDYKLEILFSGFDNGLFKRTIVIKLDDTPVMIATSGTKASNDLFLDILQNAHTTPIGVKLFSPQLGIRRGDMIVTQKALRTIDDEVISDYMKTLDIDKDLYFRTSTFTHDEQSMELKEYILPGLKLIIDKYTLRL
ncbi:MAG TPA: hypothetical protein VKR58_03200 [Aquella sp.]|nr:hypothetical protein [Aquella sp.]